MPFIEDELTRVIRLSSESGDDWCVTLEAREDLDKWVQLTAEYVNLSYPLSAPPEETLAAIDWPAELLAVADCTPGEFVTFTHPAGGAVPDVAAFVRRYIEQILQEPSEPRAWTLSEETI